MQEVVINSHEGKEYFIVTLQKSVHSENLMFYLPENGQSSNTTEASH